MANLKNTSISDTGFLQLPAGNSSQRPGSPDGREIRFNTETGKLEQFRPDVGEWIAPANTGVIATGGDSVYDVDAEGTTYRVHVFTSTGTSTFSVNQGGEVEYAIIGGGGGGGGGFSSDAAGGGGGAGAFISGTVNTDPNSYTITVGNGGAGGDGSGESNSDNNRTDPGERDGQYGGDSSAFGITANGGGGGPTYEDTIGFSNGNASAGGNGGAGDGAGNANSIRSSGGEFGNDGGLLGGTGQSNDSTSCGGGGGAGTRGGDGTANTTGGAGGDGLATFITGTSTFYAAGGGGGSTQGSTAQGGLGGGGDAGTPTGSSGGNNGDNGTANTGSGGGGASAGNIDVDGGSGGSGIVVIRYPLRQENPVSADGKVVNDGIVLDLDFAKPTVYNGSGTVVTDSRLNGIEGTIINSPSFINPRTHRSAFEFNGSTQGINLGVTGGVFFDPSNFTYLGWAWHETADFDDWEIIIGSRAGTDHQIGGEDTTRTFAILTNSTSSDSGTENYTTNKVIADSQWHHIVSTFDNGSLKAYVDTENVIDVTTSGTSVNFDDPIGIGYEPDRNSRHWNGRISLAQIYTRALTEQEVIDHFEATRWRFGV